jgi:hypothetical protein
MSSTRSRIVVIIAKIIGIVLLGVALSMGQDALQIKAVGEKDVFTIKGRVRFAEKTGEGMWRPKKQVLVQVEAYPALFLIDTKSSTLSEAHFNALVMPGDTARIALHRDQLALLYTPATIKLYGISLQNGKTVYSFNDAFQRDKEERFWLYLQAGICLLGGLILLFLPKKYLIKD